MWRPKSSAKKKKSFTYFLLRNKNSSQTKKRKRKEEGNKKKRSNRSAATPISHLAGQAKLEFSTKLSEREATDRRRDFLEDFGFVGN
jgi:hypothetical protein